ncbi:1-phosphatidylinositol 4,5-bisphosphate phosphodiesterase beta-1-like isoform X2 [Oscarella lobularis]|uniref:1-phosphatidylinositol 4,5-bisphosphate phosphodiesterase beta-1-like isoform X2 n=1 Tax=Oscarella lobularis TaxID=121494 RepID=UPI003313489E
MAGAGSRTVKLAVVKPTSLLLEETIFKRWDEEVAPHDCTLRVDEAGLVLRILPAGKESTYLDLCHVSDVRLGSQAKHPKDAKIRDALGQDADVESRMISIAYGINVVDVNFCNLVASSSDLAVTWSRDLSLLTHNLVANNGNVISILRKSYAKLCFIADANGSITNKSLMSFFSPPSKDDKVRLKVAMEAMGLLQKEAFFLSQFPFDKFLQLYMKYVGKLDKEKLFSSINGGKKPFITLAQLKTFLNKTQRDSRLNEILHPPMNDKQVSDLISRNEPEEQMAKKGHLTLVGFERLLLSEDNPVVNLGTLDMTHDMDQPLSHYFINSSHNTYLTGHQLTGKSSVEMYRQALLTGCRCVELDCWDGNDDEPIITHGHTMCTDISFKEVIFAINDCAFKTSEFPVILSFENHCSASQQLKMTQYCQEIFKEKLLRLPIEGFPLDPGVPLPSPNLLRGKILIKNKKKAQLAKSDSIDPSKVIDSSKDEKPEEEAAEEKNDTEEKDGEQAEVSHEPHAKLTSEKSADVIRSQVYTWEGQSETQTALSDLVNYITPIRFKGFEEAERKNRAYEMSSLNEAAAADHLKRSPVEFALYNRRQISRIYPKGIRYDSSNYMPQVFWNAGCQMVSLNFQTCDLPFQLHLGKFEQNNQCGYILKPLCMRRGDKDFDPFVESPMENIVAASLQVKVVSGTMLCDRKCGVYVELDMYGLPTDTVRRRFKTKIVPGNAVNPVWDEEPFNFKKIVLPELAMIRFGVYDDGNRCLGQRVLPMTSLMSGYRHIPLRNEFNQPLDFASIFVHFEVTDYVPKAYSDFLDALENPIAYQSAQEKRGKILEELLDDADDEMKQSAGEDGPRESSPPPVATASVPEDEATGIRSKETSPQGEDITTGPDAYTILRKSVTSHESRKEEAIGEWDAEPMAKIKTMKDFKKLFKKNLKDFESLKKKHVKAIATVKRSHDKELLKWRATHKAANSNGSDAEKVEEELTKLTDKHGEILHEVEESQAKDELELRKKQLDLEFRLLGRLMATSQASQLKRLDSKHQKISLTLEKSLKKEMLDQVKEFKESEQKNVADKGELDRKLREQRKKLASQIGQKLQDALETQANEKERLVQGHESMKSALKEEEEEAIRELADLYGEGEV